MHAYFSAQQTADEARRAGGTASEAKGDFRGSELHRAETMRLYELILADYVNFDRNDEVLLNLGFNLSETGRPQEAEQRYLMLLDRFRRSRFAADAAVMLGDLYFDVVGNLAKARAQYEWAAKSSSARIQTYAVYKLAWCDFNVGNYEGAREKLQATVSMAEQQKNDRVFTDLKTESLSDLVRVFVELKRPADAVDYFKHHAPSERQVDLLIRLADGLQSGGFHEPAVGLYLQLITSHAVDRRMPMLHMAAIRSFEKLKQRDQVKTLASSLGRLLMPQSAWMKANHVDAALVLETLASSEESLRIVVTEYHQEATKTSKRETWQLSRSLYETYLSVFAERRDVVWLNPNLIQMQFYFAEVLWALQAWRQAADAYKNVILNYDVAAPQVRSTDDKKHRKLAAYSAILATERLLGEGNADEISRKEIEQKLIFACDRFVEQYRDDSRAVDVAVRAASLLIGPEDWPTAMARLQRIAADFHDSPHAPRALAQAVSLAMANQRMDLVIEAGTRFIAEFPSSPLQLQVRQSLATAYEKGVDLLSAAQMNESLQAQWELPDAAFNAAVLYAASSRRADATRMLQLYVTRWPKRPDVPSIYLRMAELMVDDGQAALAWATCERFQALFRSDRRATEFDRLVCLHRQFVLAPALKKDSERKRLGQAIVAKVPTLKLGDAERQAAQAMAAEVLVTQMEEIDRPLEAIVFTDVGALKRQLSKAEAQLASLDKLATQVLDKKSAKWIVAALTLWGKSAIHVAKAIGDVPNPPGLSPEEADLFRTEIDRQLVAPLVAKAEKSIKMAIAKSIEFSVVSPWSKVAREMAATLKYEVPPQRSTAAFVGNEIRTHSNGDRSDVEVNTQLALVHRRAGRLEQAELTLRQILQRRQDDLSVYKNLVQVLIDQKKIDAARFVNELISKQSKSDPYVYNAWGQIEYLRGDVARAAEAFSAALDADSNFGPAAYNLGAVAREVGDAEKAERFFARAKQLGVS